MKTANFPGRKTERRKRALARFSILPQAKWDSDEGYARYVARKEQEKNALEARTR